MVDKCVSESCSALVIFTKSKALQCSVNIMQAVHDSRSLKKRPRFIEEENMFTWEMKTLDFMSLCVTLVKRKEDLSQCPSLTQIDKKKKNLFKFSN